jgi:phosphoribosyl 1,2-cyclic phosphate phosphodiesterase
VLTITILGSGTSHGVPMIGCDCAVCTSSDPRDKRTRPSVLAEIEGHRLLVDTSPELRLQLVAARIGYADAVLFTHSHADHMHGIDDVRRFNELLRRPVPVFAAPEVLEDIRARFGYIFAHQYFGGGIPSLDLHPITGPFSLFGHMVVPVPVWHGATPVLGFRFGPIAYVTDTSNIPAESLALLQDLEVLIIDALRCEPHPTHFNFAQALAVVEELRPRRAYFTHLTHGTAHAELERMLPPHVRPAYDGLRLEFSQWD